jgi:hypothetical protein
MKKIVLEQLKEQYGNKLTNHQAVQELGLGSGRELGSLLYTDRLPSLSVLSVANYLSNSYPKLTLHEKLTDKYSKNRLKTSQFAFELGLTAREARALLDIYMIPYGTVDFVVDFLNREDEIFEKLTKKRVLKVFYWQYKLTPHEIASIVGSTYNVIRRKLDKYNLGKRKNKIKARGKIGFKMPQSQRVKHRNQPYAKKVIGMCPRTFQILYKLRSVNSSEEFGFQRENVRRSCKCMKIALLNGGYPKGFTGVHKGVKFFYAEEFTEKKKELLELVVESVKKHQMNASEAHRVFRIDGLKDLYREVQ